MTSFLLIFLLCVSVGVYAHEGHTHDHKEADKKPEKQVSTTETVKETKKTEEEDDKKVCVDVYYESLCPDSIKFITKQLYPALQGNLAKFVNVTLVPYGKSNTTEEKDGGLKFSCHHGPGECRGNKIHSCAIRTIDGGKFSEGYGFNKATTGFVNCLLETVKNDGEKTEFPTKECGKKHKLTEEQVGEIEKCAENKEGDAKLKEFGDLTASLQKPLKSVPTVVFNKQFKLEDSQAAQEDFIETVCKFIKKDKPAECHTEKA